MFCTVKTPSQATAIIEGLRNDGFPLTAISAIGSDSHGRQEVGHVIETKAPEGIAAGAITGGMLGGTLGLLAGIGALAIPGVGPLIAAGPILGALSGAGAGAAVGGLAGGLVGLGVPEIEAKRYEEQLTSGNFLISVNTDGEGDDDRAEKIFKAHGAEDIVKSVDAAVPSLT